MCSRVVGSSAPNGSSIRMMRGDRISVRAIATRCRMPPDSSLGYLCASRFDVEADLGDPLARPLAPLAAPARRGTRARTRRCPRPCGCRTRCSPGTPCRGRSPGRATGLPPTSTVPSVAGWCGRSPAISRSTVDLPQPDGPRMAMNSPLSGQVRHREGHVADDRDAAEPLRDVLELDDVRRRGCGGGASDSRHVSPRPRDTGNRPRWNQNSSAVDAVGEQADDEQDQDDVLRQAAPLAGHQQIAEAVLGVDQLGQHDVAERQAEQVPQAVVDVGQRQRHQHLARRSAAATRRASARSRRSGRARRRSRATASE